MTLSVQAVYKERICTSDAKKKQVIVANLMRFSSVIVDINGCNFHIAVIKIRFLAPIIF